MFKEISPYEIPGNACKRIGKEWALLTAGNAEACNTMTISWGQLGELWGKPVATVYVRDHRYTYEFVEREDYFSLSFFGEGNQREALQLLGVKSGRDGDKIAEAGLHTLLLDGVPAFTQADTVLVCKKLYRQPVDPACFLQQGEKDPVNLHYPLKDYHICYTAEIVKAYVK